MRLAVAAALLVLASLLAGAAPVSGTHDPTQCARTVETIRVGTGDLLIEVQALDGVNHFDVFYPACSNGAFNIDHTSETVVTQQHCVERFLRVYAGVGETSVTFVINWLPGGCAGGLDGEGPDAGHRAPAVPLISAPSANIPNKPDGLAVFAPIRA